MSRCPKSHFFRKFQLKIVIKFLEHHNFPSDCVSLCPDIFHLFFVIVTLQFLPRAAGAPAISADHSRSQFSPCIQMSKTKFSICKTKLHQTTFLKTEDRAAGAPAISTDFNILFFCQCNYLGQCNLSVCLFICSSYWSV